MSVVGSWVNFPLSMASGATLTNSLDISNSWGSVYLEVPSMTSQTQLFVQAAVSAQGTYRRIAMPTINSSTVAANNDFTIASAVTSRMVPIPNAFRYIKIESTATVDNGVTFRVICGN